jgi:ubiquitin-conjugating enzyme E2 A
MSTPAQRRLIKDLEKVSNFEEERIIAAPVENNLLLWTATIEGPDDTPWEGGIFTLRMKFTEKYPNTPPNVKFLSKMYHPNIYNDGRICLDRNFPFIQFCRSSGVLSMTSGRF